MTLTFEIKWAVFSRWVSHLVRGTFGGHIQARSLGEKKSLCFFPFVPHSFNVVKPFFLNVFTAGFFLPISFR